MVLFNIKVHICKFWTTVKQNNKQFNWIQGNKRSFPNFMPMGTAFNTSEGELSSLKVHKIILLIQYFFISVGATYMRLRG